MFRTLKHREFITALRNKRTGEQVFTSSIYPQKEIDGRLFIVIYTLTPDGNRKILGSMAKDNFERVRANV